MFPLHVAIKGTAGNAIFQTEESSSIHTITDLPISLGPFINGALHVQEAYLNPYQKPKQILKHSQRFMDKSLDYSCLIQQAGVAKIQTRYEFLRHQHTGRLDLNSYEKSYFEESGLNAENSTSISREPVHLDLFVKGKSTNIPFHPGGFDKPSLPVVKESVIDHILDLRIEELYTIPPGFGRGFQFSESTLPAHFFLNIQDLCFSIDGKSFPTATEDDVMSVCPGLQLNDPTSMKDVDSLLPVESDNMPVCPGLQLNDPTSMKDVDSLLPVESDNITALIPKAASMQGPREWVHMVDVNQDFPEFNDLVPEMAQNYNFELDVFQKRAVYHLENAESVFVAAHTSAGKTVVAEYAIALAMKHMTRAVYTSPIKALSNQKYRDFKEKFQDVGILTGDIQIKPEAACLIMTTEILRSMLYRGADLIRDVEFVIFDEVHYLNDAERGVVWEEVIIMLPEHVTLILLSATVPNTREFAGWVGRTKKKDMYVISTLKRPVPLEHFLFGERELHQIVDANKNFVSSGYKKIYEIFHAPRKEYSSSNDKGGRGAHSKGKRSQGYKTGSGSNQSSTDKNMYVTLISFLKKRNQLPAIVFVFSKKKCDEYAQALSNLDLTSGAAEKARIHLFVQNSISCLNGTDRELPQILSLTELLYRGIAVHHSGLLPILKEIVEILFTRGLVKVLFATETFAMGVNAPAKTVVFAMIRKHDGSNFRNLLPGEYTQMAGRAGRRGLDTTGMVIIACSNDVPEELDLRTMILGKATKLESQFRVTYNMILNLLRVEAIKVEDMIKRSFSENATQKALPEQEKQHLESVKKLSKIEKLECGICVDIRSYYETSYRALTLGYMMQERIINSAVGSKALSSGRVVLVNNQMYRNSIGVILKGASAHAMTSLAQTATRNMSETAFGTQTLSRSKDSEKSFLIGLIGTSDGKSIGEEATALPINHINIPLQKSLRIEIIPFTAISIVLSKQIKIPGNIDDLISLKREADLSALLLLLSDVATDLNADNLEYDWSKIRDLDFQEQYRERSSLMKEMKSFQCAKCPDLLRHYGNVHQEKRLQETLCELEHNLSDLNLELLPDYHQRISVLKDLQFIDKNSIVQVKGRVACEINTADELILTELILENFLNDFEPAEIVALLSCFVFQEKSQSQPVLTSNLQRGIEKIKKTAFKIAEIQQANGLDVLPEDVVNNLNFGLVEVVYEWARGLPFKHITDLTDALEGSIVRCIVRLSETCRECSSAARLVGDGNLFRKLEEAASLIKRDIVFAASLYF